ncbi:MULTISPECIES: hypothetical protein [unclassified Pseudomonas]|uniref:hypothetical protein n=1 Tax=unclassified Pseudomonas TaxID=196821 RepID=UPI00192AC795|nr:MULTISPECIES: hypothetical protein [unclassified Pseudomonas]MPS99494.1 hypothetical protein [Pseudomonas sp.]QQZ38333.1 hypothetical protein IF103_10620 [Pseudomonas sp. SK2]
MKRRIVWKSGCFVVLKVRDGLYTVARMVGSAVLCVYDIFREEDFWGDIAWAEVKPLFYVFVGSVVQKKMVVRKIEVEGVQEKFLVPQRYWIDPYTSLDKGHFKGGRETFSLYGGRLIDVGDCERVETYGAPVVKHDLSVCEDRDIIESHELTNMWGDEDLSDRLSRYYDTGINRDDLKFEIFPGLWEDREKLRPLTRRLPVPLR